MERITGVVYLLYFAAAIVGEVVLQQAGISGFGVPTDAAATARTLLAHQTAFQIGFALGLVSLALYVALTALFYWMFKPVSARLSLLAAFFSLTGQAVAAVGSLFQLAPIVILGGDKYLNVFSEQQLQALALLSLNLGGQVGAVALPFDGLFLLVIGYLIYRSTFLPRVLGVLVALAGVGWLTFLAPPLSGLLTAPVEVLGVAAEAAFMLWLLVRGVNRQRWEAMATTSTPAR